MLAFFLLLAAAADAPRLPASIDGLPIGALPPQALPAQGCAAYLFTTGRTRLFAAMATATPGSLRVAIDGRTVDYPLIAQTGAAALGLAATSQYRAGDTVVTLDLTVAPRDDVTQGAVVSAATLRLDRPGQDIVAIPLGGLIGCST